MAIDATLVRATTFATGITAGAGGIDADETLVIGGKTYTAKATISETDGFYLIGVDIDATLKNLVDAINVGSGLTEVGVGVGVGYATATTRNPAVRATWTSTGRIDVFALVPGSIGNVVPVTGGTSAVSWDAALLAGGTGNVADFIEGLIALNAINSEVLSHLKVLTVAAD